MKYSVHTFRAAGLQARWTRTRNGTPIIAAREGTTGPFYVIEVRMFADMHKYGVLEAFRNHTLLSEFFSIPA